MVADVNPDLRIRFSTSHPKDITDEVLHTMARNENVCNYIHLPVQSGNTAVLDRMNRTYSREWYLDRVRAIREIIGEECGISSDMIAGFCGETEEEHQETLTLMEIVRYNFSFMFYYSERPGTLAEKKFKDDIDLETKKRRLNDIIALQQKHSEYRNQQALGKTYKVLIEGESKRSTEQWMGRNTSNTVVIFDKGNYKKGDYAYVKITGHTTATLLGEIEIRD
jgi:tRNA-2-methylthio-N6-dimethylallyladenosine synthase